MKRKLLLLFLCIGLCITHVAAQQITVSGKVTSANDNSPLPGVSVKIKNKSGGSRSDESGNYSISAQTGDVLVFSFIGAISQEVQVTGNKVINVKLAEDSRILNEVAVTAFGVKQEVRDWAFLHKMLRPRIS